MPKAYYNEFDKYAAEWLRNLIAAGHIAPGEVDQRSIEDVRPSDLAGFTQCHFFAGVGVWSLALRRAGWPDSRPVWTGSCPCQPFSAAGKGKGFADERHLWPAWFHLIGQRNPDVVFGEQVSSKDADIWVDLVQTDMEALGYAFGAVPFPSAGVGAPHIRDRLYWLADSDSNRYATNLPGSAREAAAISGVNWPTKPSAREPRGTGGAIRERPSPTNGHWRAADWLLCRDGKWRPVEPQPQQMVDGFAQSLGRLRPDQFQEVTKEVIEYVNTAKIDPREALLDVWLSLAEEALRRTSRRLQDVCEAPVLLAYLRELQNEGWGFAEGLPRPSAKATERSLRMLCEQVSAARSPHRRGLDEQQTCESANTVRVLSSILARHAQTCWGEAFARHVSDAFPLIIGSKSRVGRLRAYGNAINAEAAEAVIRSYMECRP